ncbi:hypothetical protein ACAG25_14070 [Mycobacterium sp. pV006]|uniref:hypothetical protein n=1 Tax=Mycobacterium sp. pV006 TaxID=3238983 RepID=UPI00351B0DB0
MTVRPDNRLADAPMQPVDCWTCDARVLVRKSSWEQTSVQWNGAARQRCAHTSSADPIGAACRTRNTLPGFVLGCPDLRDSIEAAVRQGALRVLDDTSATPA